MVNWEQIAEQALLYWQEFISWFLGMPIYVRVLLIIGAVASIILAVILVYFVLKSVAYLIYYILKGTYLLLKAIFLGIYMLFEELYYAISGKPKPVKEPSDKKCCEQVESSNRSVWLGNSSSLPHIISTTGTRGKGNNLTEASP